VTQQTYGQGPAPQYPAHPGLEQPTPGYEQFPQQQKTNTMAILGLVFAFVFTPLGIVFSAIGLSQIKKRRESGRGLAVAGLILSIVFLLIGIMIAVFVLAAASEIVENTAEAAPAIEELAEDLEELEELEELEGPVDAGGSVPAGDASGVLAACEVILPALVAMDAGLTAAATPEDFAQVVVGTRSTLDVAAAGTTDAQFVADVQLLSDDLQTIADAVSAGEDPTPLEGNLTESATYVGEDCALAGYVE
jgi:Domain of unknown function (DUF4190)